YVGALSSTERARVSSYLALKYGIDLSGNYLNSTGGVVWNDATDSSHNFAVFGLGRDSTSALRQKVSRSVESSDLTLALQNDFTSSNASSARTIAFNSDFSYFLTGSSQASIA
ncbi:MAG: hypothetical protein VW258_12825, partial [Thalassolituus sp.]